VNVSPREGPFEDYLGSQPVKEYSALNNSVKFYNGTQLYLITMNKRNNMVITYIVSSLCSEL
jgi:hypothetical protein